MAPVKQKNKHCKNKELLKRINIEQTTPLVQERTILTFGE
jgi:hypothetical protein